MESVNNINELARIFDINKYASMEKLDIIDWNNLLFYRLAREFFLTKYDDKEEQYISNILNEPLSTHQDKKIMSGMSVFQRKLSRMLVVLI